MFAALDELHDEAVAHEEVRKSVARKSQTDEVDGAPPPPPTADAPPNFLDGLASMFGFGSPAGSAAPVSPNFVPTTNPFADASVESDPYADPSFTTSAATADDPAAQPTMSPIAAALASALGPAAARSDPSLKLPGLAKAADKVRTSKEEPGPPGFMTPGSTTPFRKGAVAQLSQRVFGSGRNRRSKTEPAQAGDDGPPSPLDSVTRLGADSFRRRMSAVQDRLPDRAVIGPIVAAPGGGSKRNSPNSSNNPSRDVSPEREASYRPRESVDA